MPPKKGIVKSGNAGNSSKSIKSTPVPPSDAPPPLFPPGSKYPLSLLQERCVGVVKVLAKSRSLAQVSEKWVVKTYGGNSEYGHLGSILYSRLTIQRKLSGGYSFYVTLSYLNPKTSLKENVRLEVLSLHLHPPQLQLKLTHARVYQPHPPYVRPTAPEARQWGATYALYRVASYLTCCIALLLNIWHQFCNSIQLHLVLPPGPRDYWNELAAEHKNAPEHMKWMYSADPFAARREVDDRQAKSAKKREEPTETVDTRGPKDLPASAEFSQAPEVKMASSLRELVEDAVKKVGR